MRPYLTASLFVLALSASPAFSQTSADRVTGWRSDLSYWLDQLTKQHYVYKSKPLPPALVKAADELSRNIPRYSDDRVIFEMQRLAAYVGDGHTYVLPLGAQRVPGSMLPLRFYLFGNELYVIDANPGFEKWIGSRLVAIGSTPASKILDRLKPTISSDNPFAWKWIGPPFLNLRGAIESLTDTPAGDSIPVTLRDRDGTSHVLHLATFPPPRMQGVPKLMASKLPGAPAAPLWLSNVSRNLWMKPMSPGTLYVQFNQVMDESGHTLAQAAEELGKALADNKTGRLIIDVRHNNGGNSYLYRPIIDELIKWESVTAKGKLYVLTGRNTFSAAQNFIAQLDNRTRAIFVGEPSSSKPNFVGEENDIQLPWSGAIASISNRYHENIPGDKRGWIEPDIRIDLTADDYFANRDPVLERVLRL